MNRKPSAPLKPTRSIIARSTQLIVIFAALIVGEDEFSSDRARAAGAPQSGGLSYSGRLEDTNGNPLTGSHAMVVNFWSTAEGGNEPLCATQPTSVTLTSGRFSIVLPDLCAARIAESPDVWIEVSVDELSLGRTKARAVPYALEADHATRASAATGALSATLDALTERLDAVESRQVGDCVDITGPCGAGTFEQPTYFLDRVASFCPQERPLLNGLRFLRCGEIDTAAEGLAFSLRCCAL